MTMQQLMKRYTRSHGLNIIETPTRKNILHRAFSYRERFCEIRLTNRLSWDLTANQE